MVPEWILRYLNECYGAYINEMFWYLKEMFQYLNEMLRYLNEMLRYLNQMLRYLNEMQGTWMSCWGTWMRWLHPHPRPLPWSWSWGPGGSEALPVAPSSPVHSEQCTSNCINTTRWTNTIGPLDCKNMNMSVVFLNVFFLAGAKSNGSPLKKAPHTVFFYKS